MNGEKGELHINPLIREAIEQVLREEAGVASDDDATTLAHPEPCGQGAGVPVARPAASDLPDGSTDKA